MAVGGVIMFWIGAALQHVGKHGLAGSGLILDPKQAIEDNEPINRSEGSQMDDFLDEIKIDEHLGFKSTTVVKVKCRSCEALNEETDKFCGQCGNSL